MLDTQTIPTEPRDYCFGGTCATCDGHNGQCICPCHARQHPQEQEQETRPRTLAEILAARTRKLDRERQELADQTRRETEGRRQDEITAFTVRYEQMFPASLRDALNATIGYDTDHENGSEDEPERGAFATFEHDGELWIIRHARYYGNRYWQLQGPHDYSTNLGDDFDYAHPAGPLLDALNAYPHWLADTLTREQKKAEQKAESAAAEEPTRPDEQPLYAYVAGDDPGHLGFLNTGARVWIRTETPETGEYGGKHETIRAQIIDWDAQWLLINEDDRETQQRLIPIARVVSIQARA